MAASIFNCLAQRLGVLASASWAGTQSAERVHPNVVQVMEEWGIDLTRCRSGADQARRELAPRGRGPEDCRGYRVCDRAKQRPARIQRPERLG